MAVQSVYMKMSLAILGLSCYLLIVHVFVNDYVLYHEKKLTVNHRSIGVLLPTAVCFLVTALAILFSVCILPHGKISPVLKILTAVFCVIGGTVELSGIIVWNESWKEFFEQTTADRFAWGSYYNFPTNKPFALRLRYAATNVHLVVNVLLAYLIVPLLLIDVLRTARETDPANLNESTTAGSSAAVQSHHHSGPKAPGLVKIAGFLLLLAVVVPASGGIRFLEDQLYGHVKWIHYESVSVMVPMAFCSLVVSFLLISWVLFCPSQNLVSRFAKILAVIGGFTGGVLEFASVVILGYSLYQVKDQDNKIERARLDFTVPLTLFMLSAISAAISAVLIIVDLFVKKANDVGYDADYRSSSEQVRFVKQSDEQTQNVPTTSTQPAVGGFAAGYGYPTGGTGHVPPMFMSQHPAPYVVMAPPAASTQGQVVDTPPMLVPQPLNDSQRGVPPPMSGTTQQVETAPKFTPVYVPCMMMLPQQAVVSASTETATDSAADSVQQSVNVEATPMLRNAQDPIMAPVETFE